MNLKSIIGLLCVALFFAACESKKIEETTGEFRQIELPDSSIVYLNHNSKISYDESFNPRRVHLSGEAFFSVNEGSTPFVVVSDEGEEVVVEGTEFFLAASPAGLILEVEIGSVAVRLNNMEPRRLVLGERMDYTRHDNGLHLGHAKHGHHDWIYLMDLDFKKSGMVLKRSHKHAGPHSFISVKSGKNKVKNPGKNPNSMKMFPREKNKAPIKTGKQNSKGEKGGKGKK
ncbi:MAG: FecR family protein [Bacteroidota bacterium]|nr:FecR family protein [Bacteroidota bacterium]MDX5431361.1 FecR family protein [Bacteroidota bacterium]MDX5470091.1 FecR family protein [Bacteroidota bacterium]